MDKPILGVKPSYFNLEESIYAIIDYYYRTWQNDVIDTEIEVALLRLQELQILLRAYRDIKTLYVGGKK